MILCSNCHNIVKDYDWRKARCLAPENRARVFTEPVGGTQTVEWLLPLCKDARANAAACGPEGSWFRQREEPPPVTKTTALDLGDLEIEI